MDKESIIALQKIDCNCNDCKYMSRDMERFKQSLSDHHRWSLDYFNAIKNKLLNNSSDWLKRGYTEKAKATLIEANKMKFQFDRKKCYINYGTCIKFSKPVSFIPNVCQLETQECFESRR